MRRGGSLNRRTPMPSQRRPMHRNEPLRGGGPIVRTKAPRFRVHTQPVTPQLRGAVFDRALGRCDLCGKPVRATAWDPHHRKLKGQGGKDEVQNLLCLHRTCHDRVHANPEWAYRAGLLVRSHDDPAERPVWHRDSRWRTAGEREWIGCPAPADAA